MVDFEMVLITYPLKQGLKLELHIKHLEHHTGSNYLSTKTRIETPFDNYLCYYIYRF
ncbi:hypothetical protein GMMP1_330015 [Candidatus Magnetomoraceae bacterium gMMP-1]